MVLAAVEKGLAYYRTKNVTVVGHSLGGALGLLDILYLSLHLPRGTSFKFIGYGMPRVGDASFAAYMDSELEKISGRIP